MGKLIQNILDSLRLTDEDDFEDDFEDEEQPITRTRTREISKSSSSLAAARESQSSQAPKRFETTRPIRSVQTKPQPVYEEEEVYESPRKVTRQQERQVAPMRSASHGLEVIIKRPTSFDDAQEICDLLKTEHAIIVNLERLDHELAQKMMDFISGAIYALDAKIHQISGYIFCISPEKVDISGDYFNMLSESTGFKIPELLKN